MTSESSLNPNSLTARTRGKFVFVDFVRRSKKALDTGKLIYMIQKNIENLKFSRLTAIQYSRKNKFGILYWLFRCDCGNEKVINKSRVTTGSTKSCGCLWKEYKFKGTHNLSKKNKSIYMAWATMLSRCNNPKNKNYNDYGGRGIKVCDRWLNSFENFLSDMGNKPSTKHSLDRIDNDGNYEPSNCRWATSSEQIANTRRVIKIQFNGQIKIAKDWAREYNLNYQSFLYLYKKTKDIEFALAKAKKM